MAAFGVDPSVFARAAELLSRPLSPTALEKEQLQKGRGGQPEVRLRPAASPARSTTKPKAKPKARVSPGGSATAAAAAAAPQPEVESTNENLSPQELPFGGGASSSTASACNADPAAPAAHSSKTSARGASGGILGAVAELGDLQKEWKEKLHSDQYRKAPVPKQLKVMTDEERHDKLDENDILEQQLQELKKNASAITAAANAAADFVVAEAARLGVPTDEHGHVQAPDEDGEKEANDPSRLAEERVKARRRQEAQERKERERRDLAALQAKQKEAEAKAKELEMKTKERMHSRLKAEKERQQQEREELARQQQQREQRAAGSEELRMQAAKRVAEREHAERCQAQEAAELEALMKRQAEELREHDAREGYERTRQRMQLHAQELRAHQLAADEQQRLQYEAEAAQLAEQQHQAQLSQQRARARAAEYRQRTQQEAEERTAYAVEEQAIEQELAQAALAERQQKRHSAVWRTSDPVPAQLPSYGKAQPSPAGSTGDNVVEAPLRRDVISDAPPSHPSLPSKAPRNLQAVKAFGSDVVDSVRSNEVMAERPTANKAAPSKAPHVEAEAGAKRAARAPPRPPSDRISRQPGKPAAQAKSQTRGKANRQGEPDTGNVVFDAPARESRPMGGSVVVGGEDEPIRVNCGFFGVSDVEFLREEDEEKENNYYECAAEVPAMPSVAKAPLCARDSYSSRHSTPEQRAAPAVHASTPPSSRGIVRALSQPPPSRPPVLPSSRAESPSSSRGDDPPEFCNSPGAASNRSDPVSVSRSAPRAQSQPWRQKPIQVAPADYYLNMLKAARGGGKPGPASKAGQPKLARKASEGGDATEAWCDNRPAYGDQLRKRASVVEATQRDEEGAKQERSYAVLQRVQQRVVRSASTDSAPGQMVSA